MHTKYIIILYPVIPCHSRKRIPACKLLLCRPHFIDIPSSNRFKFQLKIHTFWLTFLWRQIWNGMWHNPHFSHQSLQKIKSPLSLSGEEKEMSIKMPTNFFWKLTSMTHCERSSSTSSVFLLLLKQNVFS